MTVVDAVIYDLDGTLLDTEPLSARAIASVIGAESLPRELQGRLVGLRDTDWSRLVIEELGLARRLTAQQLLEGWAEHLHKLWKAVEPRAGALELTQRVFDMGLPAAIATSSSRSHVDVKRTSPFVKPIFDRVVEQVFGDDPELERGKPAPDIFLLAARRLGVNPTRCIVFEDSLNGAKAANSAGMIVVSVPDSRFIVDAEHRACFQHLSLYTVDSLDEFLVSHWHKFKWTASP